MAFSRKHAGAALLTFASGALAQTSSDDYAVPLVSATTASGTATVTAGYTFANPTGYSTKTYNANGFYSTNLPNRVFDDERLNFLWDQVGPIATGPITTTVSPTAEPSVFPTPGIFHTYVPSYQSNLSSVKLPDNFLWGIAASAYQSEGAAKDEGKGPSIWDLIAHRQPNAVADNSTGDVVAEFYYLYKQDIARMKALGIKAFSPSISWPRIFPFGKGPVNQAGVAHYDDVIATMLENDITPVITLFHWDTPLALFNEYGAWIDPQIVDDYFNYAKFIISRYDDYVPIWYTFNEPQYCNWQFSSYPAGRYYPDYQNLTGGIRSEFLCGHYTLLAHAKVANWYHNVFKGKGRITFKNSGNYFEPASQSAADLDAAQRQYDFSIGWFGGPWTDGDYPQSLKTTLGDILPTFTNAQKKMIKGSCDFYAIDGYTAYYASALPGGSAACAANHSDPAWPTCANSASTDPDGFPIGPAADQGVSWLYSTPLAIRRFLVHITTVLFPTVPDIVVSEFGFAEPYEDMLAAQGGSNAVLWDLRRADYYQGFLDNILAARVEDGVNVTGAFAWSLFDNLEWYSGIRVKFGLEYLDYNTLERTPKASMFQLLNWFA